MDDLADLCGLSLESTTAVVHNEKQMQLDSLLADIYRFDQTPEEWVESWKRLNAFDYDAGEDCISNICSSYIENNVSSLRYTLETIVRSSAFSFLTRCKAADALGNLFYTLEILQDYMHNTKDDVNFTLFVDSLMQMLVYEDFQDDAMEELLGWIFTTSMISWGVKFKLYKQASEFRVKSTGFLVRLGKVLVNSNTLTQFTVLVLQLTSFDEKTLKSLFSRVKQSRDMKIKADFFDHMLNFPKFKAEALEELKKIGEGMKTLDSSQNVHMVTANVEEWLRNLTDALKDVGVGPELVKSTFKDICARWKDTLAEDKQEKLEYALQRLELDANLYGSMCYRLSNILVRVWLIIDKSEHKEELEKRLCEELIEMSETCSTGHLLRLMNVFSGYGMNAITIDPAVELRSVINKRVEQFMDRISSFGESGEKARDEIMEAWAEGNEEILQERLYPQLSRIHDELYNDYVGQGIMSPLDFTTYYRDIINKLFVV